jgi:hypothetical protein
MSTQHPLRPRSFVLRWNRHWISGDRFARDYAASLMTFTSEVAHAVTRVRRARHFPELREVQTHAVVWASVLVAFEAAGFCDQDRETLLALLLDELRPSWGHGELTDSEYAAAIILRAEAYFETRDRKSPSRTAEQIVSWYLRALAMPELVGNSALARHLCAHFSHRILRDIFRLSAASRLRTAVASLMERQRAARISDVDTRGLSIWDEGQRNPAPEPASTPVDNHWDGHPIEAIARVGTSSR